MLRDRKLPTVILRNKLFPDPVLYSIYSHAPGSSSWLEDDAYRLFWDLGRREGSPPGEIRFSRQLHKASLTLLTHWTSIWVKFFKHLSDQSMAKLKV